MRIVLLTSMRRNHFAIIIIIIMIIPIVTLMSILVVLLIPLPLFETGMPYAIPVVIVIVLVLDTFVGNGGFVVQKSAGQRWLRY